MRWECKFIFFVKHLDFTSLSHPLLTTATLWTNRIFSAIFSSLFPRRLVLLCFLFLLLFILFIRFLWFSSKAAANEWRKKAKEKEEEEETPSNSWLHYYYSFTSRWWGMIVVDIWIVVVKPKAYARSIKEKLGNEDCSSRKQFYNGFWYNCQNHLAFATRFPFFLSFLSFLVSLMFFC